MIGRRRKPIGVVLAGGLGLRLGGGKAAVELAGRPLITYPLAALAAALREVAVIAKSDTELPSMPGVTVWIEPDTPRHPLVGVIEALGIAGDRPVVVCAVDLPFVSPDLIGRLARADPRKAPAVVASCAGTMQPLLGCYYPRALEPLRRAAATPNVPLTQVVADLAPRLIEVEDPEELFNVNVPEDILHAAALLDRHRAHPKVKS